MGRYDLSRLTRLILCLLQADVHANKEKEDCYIYTASAAFCCQSQCSHRYSFKYIRRYLSSPLLPYHVSYTFLFFRRCALVLIRNHLLRPNFSQVTVHRHGLYSLLKHVHRDSEFCISRSVPFESPDLKTPESNLWKGGRTLHSSKFYLRAPIIKIVLWQTLTSQNKIKYSRTLHRGIEPDLNSKLIVFQNEACSKR